MHKKEQVFQAGSSPPPNTLTLTKLGSIMLAYGSKLAFAHDNDPP